MKVILVDDEHKFITMLAKRLAFRGIQADIVFSGNDAIKKISREEYNVAVLDIKMPGISGLELKRELAALKPDLKFIFVSGHGAVTGSEKEFVEKNIYFPKPLDIELLIQKIKELCRTG